MMYNKRLDLQGHCTDKYVATSHVIINLSRNVKVAFRSVKKVFNIGNKNGTCFLLNQGYYVSPAILTDIICDKKFKMSQLSS